MKTPLRFLLFAATFLAAATAYPNASGVEVTVKSKSGGKAVYKGMTDARGSFTTGALQPGTYNVEFRSTKAGDLKAPALSISLSAGKGTQRQASAPAKHLQGGVAVQVEVPSTAAITGQVSKGAAAQAQTDTQAPAGMQKVKANVKIINGKRHVWVPAPLGSNLGGRWVEEGTEGAVLPTSNAKGADTEALSRSQGGVPVPGGGG